MRTLLLPFLFCLALSPFTRATAQHTRHRAAQDSLTMELASVLRQGHCNGFGVAIVSPQGVRYQHGFDFADVQARKAYDIHTAQPVASVSKTVVGLTLLKAQELGLLHLDNPVNKYLPFPVVNPAFTDVPITLRHLATHTSGIRNNDFYLSKNYYLQPGQDVQRPLAFENMQTFMPADSAVSLAMFLHKVLTPTGKW